MTEEALDHGDVIRMLRGQFDELDRVYRSLLKGENLDTIRTRFSDWKDETVQLLRMHVGPRQANPLAAYYPRLSISVPLDLTGMSPSKSEALRQRISFFKSFLMRMIDTLEAHPEHIRPPAPKRAFGRSPALGGRASQAQPRSIPRVFIVHGHDETNALRLEKLLRDDGKLAPVVLRDEAAQGRTVVEKFEQEADDVRYAIVLMTPDDHVKKADNEYWQARPNVLFELGWFHGHLDRSRICLVCKNGTRIPSDLDGINRVDFRDSVEEAWAQISRELRVAGLVP